MSNCLSLSPQHIQDSARRVPPTPNQEIVFQGGGRGDNMNNQDLRLNIHTPNLTTSETWLIKHILVLFSYVICPYVPLLRA